MSKKLTYLIIAIIFFLFGAVIIKNFYKVPEKVTPKIDSLEWYDNLVFKNKHFSFQFIRRLGHSTSGGADIGECFSIAKNITDGDIDSWHTQWLTFAERLHSLAQDWEKAGHSVSAGELLMRASNYYLSSIFYLVHSKDRQKNLEYWQKARESFVKALGFLYPDGSVVPVRIPYENTTMPGYFCKAKRTKKGAPLLIIHSGFDGTAEEIFWNIGTSAVKRGYNCLIFEGPGQGEMITKQNIPFRFDWEVPITAVVNFATTLPGINKEKIALMGRSFGGYLAPRAAAFEKRIKACIANGGIFDLSSLFYKNFPKELLLLLEKDPKTFNQIISKEINKSVFSRWAFGNGMWRFAAKDPAEFMREIKKYNLRDIAQKITCPTLIVDSEAEQKVLVGQAKQLYDALECPKTFLLFTREETAQAHCQMGANLISTEKIFNWLDKTLAHI